jgi:hypothetical protein
LSEWKGLYDEIKQRKMSQSAKANIVKKVEKAGKLLAIEGKYEKPQTVVKHCYAAVKDIIKPEQAAKKVYSDYDVVLLGCPGTEIPKAAFAKIRDFVYEQGGWVLSTDWCLRSIIEHIFPGYIRWNEEKTADAVVACEVDDPHHPFMDDVQEINVSEEWSTKSKEKKGMFSWWLEDKSFPIEVQNSKAVKVLISSQELYQKWGASPVLCYFDVGDKGGRVIHMISHTHLQKGQSKSKLIMALILSNILDERVALRYNMKGQAPTYQQYDGTGAPGKGAPTKGGAPAGAGNLPMWTEADSGGYTGVEGPGYTGPEGTKPDPSKGAVPAMAETAMVQTETQKLPSTQKCALGDGNFDDYSGRILKCGGCGAPYHEACLNFQISSDGTCKICGRILLY